MVRGLVEEQQIRFGHQRLCQEHAAPPAARQRVDDLIGAKLQPLDHQLDALLGPPAAPLLELLLQGAERAEALVSGRLGDRHGRAVIGLDQRTELAETVGDHFEHRSRRNQRDVLIEPRRPQAGRPPDLALRQARFPR